MLTIPAFAAEAKTGDVLATGTSMDDPSEGDTDAVGGSDDAGNVDGADQIQADDTVVESVDSVKTEEDKGGCESSVSFGGVALMIIGCAAVTFILSKEASDDRSNASD